jgi:hypothetical protein
MSQVLYDVDFCEWTAETARLLREGRLTETDIDHIAEEIEDLGKQDSRKLQSCLMRIMEHLLKLQLAEAPMLARNCRLWQASIARQRVQIEGLLADSPSLRRKLRDMMPAAYRGAVRIVKPIVAKPIPAECPFILEQLLSD